MVVSLVQYYMDALHCNPVVEAYISLFYQMQDIKGRMKSSSWTRAANGEAVYLHEREMDIKLPLAFPFNL